MVPTNACSMACAARSFGYSEAAAVNAAEKKIGCSKAGTMRSAIKLEKFGAKADSALHTENPASAKTRTFLRSWREETSTRNGPQIATINANKPINQPAWDTVTPK